MLALRALFSTLARFFLRRLRTLLHPAELPHGEERSNSSRGLTGPTLVLPNHPGYVDPMLLMSMLWPTVRPRPLVAEDTFKNPFFYPVMKLINAISVPDVTRVDARAHFIRRRGGRQGSHCSTAGRRELKSSGRRVDCSGRGVEVLGGAPPLTEVLKEVPEANLVMIRTRGLWGSRFGFARTGKLPNFTTNLFASLGWLLASGVFFMPRRTVDITIRLVDRKELPELERSKLNPWFEAWYNAKGPRGTELCSLSIPFPRTKDVCLSRPLAPSSKKSI